MSILESPAAKSPRQRQSREASAYQDFLETDLNTIRKHRNGGRAPFGLLFELPSNASLDRLGTGSTTASRSRRKRKSDERSPARALGPSRLLPRSVPMIGPWKVYEDVDELECEKTNVGSVSVESKKEGKRVQEQEQELLQGQEQEQEEEEEAENDENEDIHRMPRPIAWLTDQPCSKVPGGPTEAWSRTAEEIFKTVAGESSTLKAHVLDSHVHGSRPLASPLQRNT